MDTPRNAPESVAMNLILWGRSRDSLPPLTRKRWQRVAAGIYRRSVVTETEQIGPSYSSQASRWTRLICGALAARASDLGWIDLAKQWGSRYWTRADQVDADRDLGEARDHIRDIEDAVRAAIADSPRR